MKKNICKITYISNAGVLITLGDKKILIDGLCDSETPMFKNPPSDLKKKIVANMPPFDNIDIMLFTHHHSDHFDPISITEYRKQNKHTAILVNHEAIRKLDSFLTGYEFPRCIKCDIPLGSRECFHVHGINIEAISLLHDGKEYEDVQNIAYLIEAGKNTILHVGDAKPTAENYLNLNLTKKNIDLLIAPFPYIGLPSGRRVIEKYIKPKMIMPVHFPYKELDNGGWISATKKSYMMVKETFIETIFLEKIGDSIHI